MNSAPSVIENLKIVESELGSAPDLDLLLLPENFAQMPARHADLHIEQHDDGVVQRKLSSLARTFKVNILAGSLAVRDSAGVKPYARSLLINSLGERIRHYDKLHLFDVDTSNAKRSQYRESQSYQHGHLSENQLSPVALKIGQSTLQLGLTICYDLRFPELYRTLAAKGAQLMCVPSAFTYETGQVHWETLLRARAIENQTFIAAPAQTGEHASGRKTWGHTMIIDPWGNIVSQRKTTEGLVFADIDLTSIESLRMRFPVHKHQRL